MINIRAPFEIEFIMYRKKKHKENIVQTKKKYGLVESANYHVKNGVVFVNYTFSTAIESLSDNHGCSRATPPQ